MTTPFLLHVLADMMTYHIPYHPRQEKHITYHPRQEKPFDWKDINTRAQVTQNILDFINNANRAIVSLNIQLYAEYIQSHKEMRYVNF